MGEARQVHSSNSSEDSTEFVPHNSTDGEEDAEAQICARCESPDDSGSPFATQWRAAVETEMGAIMRAGTFLSTHQGGANNRTTTRTRWVWHSKEPRLHKKHERMVLHGA